MTKQQLNKLSGLRRDVKSSLDTISKERDKLRNYISDIEDIAGDLDQASEDLESAHELIGQAVDTISQRN